MSLSMTSPILASDILGIKMLKEVKVYLLRGVDGKDLVIKIDAVYAPQIKGAGVVVKALDPAAKMKILTASERAELALFCKYFEELDDYYESLNVVSPFAAQKGDIAELKNALTFGEPFVKMNKLRIHNLEEAAEERGKGNKDVVRQFATTLKAANGLEDLGKVVAGDLFNANRDRFRPGAKGSTKIGPFDFSFKSLVNPGNAMIIMTDGGGFKPTMLDSVDPNSYFKDIHKSLATAEKDVGERWPGRTLVDRKLRRKFAEDIIHDIEAILSPKKSFFSLKTKLGSNAVSRLDAGMVEGARLIKARLESKYNPNRWTAGTRERYQLICTTK